MPNSFIPQPINENDVLAFGDATFKAGKFKRAVESCFSSGLGSGLSAELSNKGIQIDSGVLTPNGTFAEFSQWFDQGIDCEILKVGSQGWTKAKVRVHITVEFSTEEESISRVPPMPQPKPAPAHQVVKTEKAPQPVNSSTFAVPPELLEDVWD